MCYTNYVFKSDDERVVIKRLILKRASVWCELVNNAL